MVRNTPIVAAEGPRAANTAHPCGLGVRDRMGHMLCGLHAHDTLLNFGQDRRSLGGVSCGHETPGWELTEAPPTVTVREDARRTAAMRPHLVSARRIA